jgi:hypothetical protein
VKEVDFDATIRYDFRFFEGLNRIIQTEPWLERDRLMIDYLRTLGIEKDRPFSPDAGLKEPLEAGVQEAHAALAARYDAGLPPFYEGTHWTYPAPPELLQAAAAAFADPNHFPLDARGLAYLFRAKGSRGRRAKLGSDRSRPKIRTHVPCLRSGQDVL